VCWGNFWPTESRRLLTSFTAPYYTDHFHLIVRRGGKDESFGDVLLKAFKPFTPMLWLLFVLSLAYTGVTLTYEANPTVKPTAGQFLTSLPVSMLKGMYAFGTVTTTAEPTHSTAANGVNPLI
jgi:hypothetical protein